MARAIGDIVYLKSGSLPMTIVKAEPDGAYIVQWLMGMALTSANLPDAALCDVDPAPAINKARKAESDRVSPPLAENPGA